VLVHCAAGISRVSITLFRVLLWSFRIS
jgi:protein-tyrosine phosphatase